MEILVLNKLLNLAWNSEFYLALLMTNEEKESYVRSATTALIINDFYGGKIIKCIISCYYHYYNLIDGKIIDCTFENFFGELPRYEQVHEITREELLNNKRIKIMYEKILYILKQSIRQYQGKKFRLIDLNGQEYLSDKPGTLGGNNKLKIYGKLDCPSAKRWIDKGYYIKNRVFFENEEAAISAGYRPCAICMPNEYKNWKKQKSK